jgi:hypothetical protein
VNNFSERILKAISEYKLILRKNMPTLEASSKIRSSGLKRMQLRDADDLSLFDIANKIVKDLEDYVVRENKAANYYSGAEEFLRHLKNILDDYRVEDNKVVNITHKTACAVMDAIQLVALPESKLSTEAIEKIRKCVAIISKYGDREQIDLLKKAVKVNKERLMNFVQQCGDVLNFEDLL